MSTGRCSTAGRTTSAPISKRRSSPSSRPRCSSSATSSTPSTAASFNDSAVSAFYYADKLFTPLTTSVLYSISAVMFRASTASSPVRTRRVTSAISGM